MVDHKLINEQERLLVKPVDNKINYFTNQFGADTKIIANLNLNFHWCNFIMIGDYVGLCLWFNYFPYWCFMEAYLKTGPSKRKGHIWLTNKILCWNFPIVGCWFLGLPIRCWFLGISFLFLFLCSIWLSQFPFELELHHDCLPIIYILHKNVHRRNKKNHQDNMEQAAPCSSKSR